MNIQEELKKLEAVMIGGLTAESMAQIEQIKAMATTPEDEAIIEEFVARQLENIEDDVAEMEEMTYRLQMGEVLEIVNLSYIAKKYFGRTQSWLSQRINGCTVNGKKATFTETEIETLNHALDDIAKIIGSRSVRYC
ncbi:MAG: DUF5053 domain-containing protein [Bacteroides sp.]|nr:DUF5053 domain-containing protein [Bacteroides sp.]